MNEVAPPGEPINARKPLEHRSVEPVRIALVAATPVSAPALRVGAEWRVIEERLRATLGRDRLDIQRFEAASIDELRGALLGRPHLLHFSGHGRLDLDGQAELVLEDRDGGEQGAPARALAELFDVLKGDLRLVVLGACETSEVVRMLSAHVDCAIGMGRAISDASAMQFAYALYDALGHGWSVETAFQVGCRAIAPSGVGEDDVPVLAVRSGVDASGVHLVPPPERSEPPADPERVPESGSRTPGKAHRVALAALAIIASAIAAFAVMYDSAPASPFEAPAAGDTGILWVVHERHGSGHIGRTVCKDLQAFPRREGLLPEYQDLDRMIVCSSVPERYLDPDTTRPLVARNGWPLAVIVGAQGRAEILAPSSASAWLGEIPPIELGSEAAREQAVPILYAMSQWLAGHDDAGVTGCPKVPKGRLDELGVLAAVMRRSVRDCGDSLALIAATDLLAVCTGRQSPWACSLARLLYVETRPDAHDAIEQLALVLVDGTPLLRDVALLKLVRVQVNNGVNEDACRTFEQYASITRGDGVASACLRLALVEVAAPLLLPPTSSDLHDRSGEAPAPTGCRAALEKLVEGVDEDCQRCGDQTRCAETLGSRGWVLGRRGEWRSASPDLARAFNHTRSGGQGLLLAEAYLHLGDVGRATALLVSVQADAQWDDGVVNKQQITHALLALIAARQSEGQSTDASEHSRARRQARRLLRLYESCGDSGCRFDPDDRELRRLTCATDGDHRCVYDILAGPWAPDALRRSLEH